VYPEIRMDAPTSAATILFACRRNAGRSQIAAAWFAHFADPAKARAISAGTEAASEVNPEVVRALAEIELDIADAVPRLLTARMTVDADFVVTMGCAESCPLVRPGRRADWTIDDPEGRPAPEVRRIRDEIGTMVEQLVVSKGWARSA
jgi:arsenate reductase